MMTPSALNRRLFLASALAAPALGSWTPAVAADAWKDSPYRSITDAEWKQRVPELSYLVLRHEGTERPYTSPLLNEHRNGTFACLGCGLPLFRSAWKYDSHTGWPSFWTEIPGALDKKPDFQLIDERTEYHCARCLSHQGHVFNDGPRPTGLRYCNNGAALKFVSA
jgi:peptide-methionine (R)-S-oxide reductase